ncbi:MAG: NADH-quinone oxidoreductase subunit C [Alphaproteobacteria bacterium]
MDEALKELAQYIEASLGPVVQETSVAKSELMILVGRDEIVRVMSFLRDDSNCRFAMLVDLCGADYPERPERFEIIYNLLSLSNNQRIRVKVRTADEQPVPSVTGVFPCANWFEREAWDLYGVVFSGHPDLRRILTDYGFEGHPMRKEFPLTGYVEVRYDDELKRVVYEPVKLVQEFRRFDFMSPWEGAPFVLPGDEKASDQG